MSANEPLQRSDARLVGFDRIGGGGLFVKGAGFELLDPDTDLGGISPEAFERASA